MYWVLRINLIFCVDVSFECELRVQTHTHTFHPYIVCAMAIQHDWQSFCLRIRERDLRHTKKTTPLIRFCRYVSLSITVRHSIRMNSTTTKKKYDHSNNSKIQSFYLLCCNVEAEIEENEEKRPARKLHLKYEKVAERRSEKNMST